MTHNQKLVSFGHNHEHSDTCKKEEDDDLFPSAVPAIIFDAQTLDEEVPSGFNSVRILLDATLKADLLWQKERLAAEKYIRKGFRIFWDIQLGLSELSLPIGNQSQFLSLSLALEHFRDTLWKEFRQQSIGLCIYRGSANFSLTFLWNEEELSNLRDWLKEIFIDINSFVSETVCIASSFAEINVLNLSSTREGERLIALYCRDVMGRYLELLSDCLPDTLQCHALLDIQSVSDTLLQVQLTTKERFSGINLGIRGPHFNDNVLGWEGSPGELGVLARDLAAASESNHVRVGVCLPSMRQYLPGKWKGLKDAIDDLKEKNTIFRAIPEVSLTTEWDGLDYLIVSSQNLSAQGQRKLQGFQAAGGIVILV